jgi:hypothetical protein
MCSIARSVIAKDDVFVFEDVAEGAHLIEVHKDIIAQLRFSPLVIPFPCRRQDRQAPVLAEA